MKKFLATLLFALTVCAPARAQLFILGGELSNSAATSVADIDSVMPRMAALGLNTVLVPAYWEFVEPAEGQFDYTLVDRAIDQARANSLQLVLLWFGAWKNSMSCYAPAWFKQDTRRFPRAMTRSGKQLEIASCFSDNVLQADLRAFTRLMEHVARRDPGQRTVVMVQIENEIGMLEDARDHSPLANRAYQAQQWADRYGTDIYADEKFMALSYARYVEHLAQAARRICPRLPLYVNAAMNSRGRQPGQYPSAGPLAHLAHLWHQGAPTIDLLAPDIYDDGFKQWCRQYDLHPADTTALWGRLFIPETRCCPDSGVRALYAFGEHRALGFSPFAIDQASPAETAPIAAAYHLLRQLRPLLRQPATATWGLLFDHTDRERTLQDQGTVLTCRHYLTLPWDPRATDGTPWPEGGAVVVRLAPNDYLIAGSGVVVDFKTPAEKQAEQAHQPRPLGEDGFLAHGTDGTDDSTAGHSPQALTDAANGQPAHPSPAPAAASNGQPAPSSHPRKGILSIDQVSISPDATLHYIRRDNGDQSHQGRHARIPVGEYKILHVKLYEY